MNALVSTAAVVTATVIPVAAEAADPIFAAIDRFRAAWANLDAESSALDQANTPEANERLEELFYAINRAEDALVEIEPTTVDGVRYLLQYLADFEGSGHCLTTTFEDEDDPKITTLHKEASMGYFIHRNAARALERIAV